MIFNSNGNPFFSSTQKICVSVIILDKTLQRKKKKSPKTYPNRPKSKNGILLKGYNRNLIEMKQQESQPKQSKSLS